MHVLSSLIHTSRLAGVTREKFHVIRINFYIFTILFLILLFYLVFFFVWLQTKKDAASIIQRQIRTSAGHVAGNTIIDRICPITFAMNATKSQCLSAHAVAIGPN